MAKRTKRKNNKLSKRRLSKKKLSRRRVTKKENNRKRKHINKNLLMGGSLSTPPPDMWSIRGIFNIEKNKYLKKTTTKLVYILANNRDQTYPLKLYFAENTQQNLDRHQFYPEIINGSSPKDGNIWRWTFMVNISEAGSVFKLMPPQSKIIIGGFGMTKYSYQGSDKSFFRQGDHALYELPLEIKLLDRGKEKDFFEQLINCGAQTLRFKFTYSGRTKDYEYDFINQCILNEAYFNKGSFKYDFNGEKKYTQPFEIDVNGRKYTILFSDPIKNTDQKSFTVGIQFPSGDISRIRGISVKYPEDTFLSYPDANTIKEMEMIALCKSRNLQLKPTDRQINATEVLEEIPSVNIGDIKIVVSKGSVTNFGAGKNWHPLEIAIVNAANNRGLGGGGVDEAITSAGGPHLAEDRINLPVLDVRPGGPETRIKTGDAILTGPGNYGDLHAAYVIHAVGPDYRGIPKSNGNILLQQAYENSMRVAQGKGIKYIGFSLLSSGIFRGDPEKISLDEVLKIGIDTVKANLYDGLLEVHFVAFTETEKETLLRLIETTSESVPGLGPNLEPEPEPGNEIISKIKGDYSLDKSIYTNKGETINIELFSQETGFILSKQLENSGEEGVISIQVASNALLPGGKYQAAIRDGTLDLNQINRIPKSHTTQEESVIDSLLHAAFIQGNKSKEQLSQVFENMIGKNAVLSPLSGNQRIKHRIYPPETGAVIQMANGGEGGQATKGRPWGCLYHDVKPNRGVDNTMSIQGVDFTEAIPEGDANLTKYASKYNFAYTLDDADMALSANYYLHGGVGKTSDSTFKTDVVFCYGPNVYAESVKSNKSGTMTRSKIKDYIEDEHHQKYFRECVKMSYRATLISMKENGVDYPILCYVSGGIYSGERERKKTNTFIREQIPIIIGEINEELKEPFKNIFLCG